MAVNSISLSVCNVKRRDCHLYQKASLKGQVVCPFKRYNYKVVYKINTPVLMMYLAINSISITCVKGIY